MRENTEMMSQMEDDLKKMRESTGKTTTGGGNQNVVNPVCDEVL